MQDPKIEYQCNQLYGHKIVSISILQTSFVIICTTMKQMQR